MKGITFEATVQDGRIVLPDGARIPDNTRVYVVVPETKDLESVRIMSPHLAHRNDLRDFTMEVEREDQDARLR
jgi:hypothetical protein